MSIVGNGILIRVDGYRYSSVVTLNKTATKADDGRLGGSTESTNPVLS